MQHVGISSPKRPWSGFISDELRVLASFRWGEAAEVWLELDQSGALKQ